ncbi:MAG TPA: RnfABCDGE type electron transport complex subunit D [Aestuariivirga sp.]
MNAFLDRALNFITMYRLTLYYTAALAIVAFGFGLFKLVAPDPTALCFSLVLITATCWFVNRLFAAYLNVPVNTESIYITSLILALIMPPVVATDFLGVAGLMLASTVAIASKFMLVIGRKHIFNPVAIGVMASALLLDHPATWWVGGNLPLLPLVLVGGLLVTRKLQRFDMVGIYILANVVATLLTTDVAMYGEALKETLIYSPLLFAGFAMLTEPLTAAQGKIPRLIYGTIIGTLSSPNIHIGNYYSTPEVAFLIGNIFAFLVNPKGRFKFTLLRVEEAAAGCYDFIFKPDRKPTFRAGQYLDWTLDVAYPDDRGNRRPFTIASAPTEDEVRLGVKFYQQPSAFKHALLAMKPGDAIYGSHIAGSFTLPKNSDEKLAFLAGGIGITPFRSMVQEVMNLGENRSIVMLYGNNTISEIAYSDVFDRASEMFGLKTVYAVAEPAATNYNLHHGFIDEALIKREIPDYKERTFYISGPRVMVVRFQKALKQLGIGSNRINVDFFPGFA